MSTGHAMADAAVDALRDAAPTPYWLDRAEAPAARPRVEGRVEADLVVIGAGFTGLWTAWRAVERDPGRSVVVLEAERVGSRERV